MVVSFESLLGCHGDAANWADCTIKPELPRSVPFTYGLAEGQGVAAFHEGYSRGPPLRQRRGGGGAEGDGGGGRLRKFLGSPPASRCACHLPHASGVGEDQTEKPAQQKERAVSRRPFPISCGPSRSLETELPGPLRRLQRLLHKEAQRSKTHGNLRFLMHWITSSRC